MVQLKTAQGTLVSVSEENAQRLRMSGYRDVDSTNPGPNESTPKKRGRSKKSEPERKQLEDMIWDDEAGG